MQEAQFHPSSGDWGFTCCVVWPKHKSSSLKTRNCNQSFSLLLNEKLPFWPNLDQLDVPSPVFQTRSESWIVAKFYSIRLHTTWLELPLQNYFYLFCFWAPRTESFQPHSQTWFFRFSWISSSYNIFPKNTILLNLPKVDFFCSK